MEPKGPQISTSFIQLIGSRDSRMDSPFNSPWSVKTPIAQIKPRNIIAICSQATRHQKGDRQIRPCHSHRQLPLHLKQLLFEQRGCAPQARKSAAMVVWWARQAFEMICRLLSMRLISICPSRTEQKSNETNRDMTLGEIDKRKKNKERQSRPESSGIANRNRMKREMRSYC